MRQRIVHNQFRAVAVGGVLLFLLIVLIEHLADPSLDPATHEISEYVHGPLGRLMTVGFVAWAISLAASGVLAGSIPRGKAVGVALFAAALGMVVTACFATQTSAGRLPSGVSLSVSGRLHDIGSGLASLALLAAVFLSLRLREAPRLRRTTIALLMFVLSADAVLLALGSEVGGVRQRLLVFVACIWQLGLLAMARHGGNAIREP